MGLRVTFGFSCGEVSLTKAEGVEAIDYTLIFSDYASICSVLVT